MEKASAACAMDWSIDLEKGLRSNRPGQHLQSIQLTCHRIKKWSQEPKLKLTIYNMFGMDHGEERLYADAILFRLADAFCSGDRDTKFHIVKAFLSEMKDVDRKRRGVNGIFSKMSSDNHVEILKRIKVGLDDENIESKALTLVLFGCWSEIAKDSPEIRYDILTGLQSPHAVVVEASIFAAGCVAEFLYDFACVFLEFLISLLSSPKTFSSVKLAAARAFKKIGNFHSLTIKAYKAGSAIVLKSSESDWLGTMLISLTKLASKSVSLSSEQVSLLCGFLTGTITPHTQLIVLRSLHFILEKTSHVSFGAFLFRNFLKFLDHKEVLPPLRCEALQLVIKIVLHVPYDMLMYKVQELSELLKHVADAAKSPDTSFPVRVLAVRALIGISHNLKGSDKLTSAGELNLLPLLSEVVSTIGDEAVLQTTKISECCEVSDIELQFKNLLQLLFLLINSPPEVSLLVLDKLYTILETLADVCRENKNDMEIASDVHHVIQVEENGRSFLASKILHYVHKCLYGFAQMLCAETPSNMLVYKLKHLVSFVCQCNLFHFSTHVKFALLLHSCGNFGKVKFLNLLEDGTLNRECVGNMLTGNNNWESYLVGKYAAQQGVWSVCDSVFGHLKATVQSDISTCWLTCLSQFAHTEMSLQEMFSCESGSDLVSEMDVSCQPNDFHQYILASESIEKLTCSRDDLLSSERLLGSTNLLKQKFYFQRWFLALRTKVVEVITDLLKLLATVFCSQKSFNIDQEGEGMMHLLAGLSLKSQKIAREYDLMNSSFINMDKKTYKVISTAALSCSLLAFCIGLAYLIPNSPFPGKPCSSNCPGDCLHVIVAEDLAARLSYIDPETSISIISILKGDFGHESTSAPHCKSRSFNAVYEESNAVRVCKANVGRISSMQNETVGAHDFSLPVEYRKRSLFLLDITKELMSIPFCAPKFFFQVKPCIGAVLHSCGLDNDISIMSGSHLSLNLCLQLKNIPPDLTSGITKVFCILHYKKSFLRPQSKPSFIDHQNWSTDSMLRLQEKLRDHVIEQNGEKFTSNENETFVQFEMNGGVQGFATCLIDASTFSAGIYSIDWNSCCVDDNGSYWNLLPLSHGPLFTVRSSNS